MRKIFYILFSICLLTACSSDDPITDDGGNNGTINPNAELIFNEPLLLFGKSKQEVKASETRDLVEGAEASFKEVKGNLQYVINYMFTNDKLTEITVVIENQPTDRYSETVTSLSKKYTKDKNKDMFYADSYYIYPVASVDKTSWIYMPK
ncbi:hypothetical protein M2132_001052 [Dysgonomonas sp. PH5-45]|uniref:hypothetical protein n=1 Tax=unclassified Dysgonomonas TaxID=2630389 RepID=UPI0024747953|nr:MULTISPECIES: hypothetical protein [unclassified Dysgonomonas]MDH6354723.1 hypothetical protein [Dysgonomonas sp. PH5-45]MDH6387622.1 hypothetical protein [Dysgonomonas sp. PH5-37]